MTIKNAYKLLKLDPSCTDDDIRKRFRELSKVHHPDMGGTERNFNLLVEAKDLLLRRNNFIEIDGRQYDIDVYEKALWEYNKKMKDKLAEWEAENIRRHHELKVRVGICIVHLLICFLTPFSVYITTLGLFVYLYVFPEKLIKIKDILWKIISRNKG